MKKVTSIAALFAIIACTACQHENVRPDTEAAISTNKYVPNFVLAKTNSELKLLQANSKPNILRTLKDFDILLASGLTPLSKLPVAIQQDFKNHIMFRPGIGVAGLDYGIIESQLSYDELAQVLAAFGLDVKQGYWGLSQDPKIKQQLSRGGSVQQRMDEQLQPTADDYKGYSCAEKGTCAENPKHICLSGC